MLKSTTTKSISTYTTTYQLMRERYNRCVQLLIVKSHSRGAFVFPNRCCQIFPFHSTFSELDLIVNYVYGPPNETTEVNTPLSTSAFIKFFMVTICRDICKICMTFFVYEVRKKHNIFENMLLFFIYNIFRDESQSNKQSFCYFFSSFFFAKVSNSF